VTLEVERAVRRHDRHVVGDGLNASVEHEHVPAGNCNVPVSSGCTFVKERSCHHTIKAPQVGKAVRSAVPRRVVDRLEAPYLPRAPERSVRRAVTCGFVVALPAWRV